jgi:tRNA A58 N-methylase Trm61
MQFIKDALVSNAEVSKFTNAVTHLKTQIQTLQNRSWVLYKTTAIVNRLMNAMKKKLDKTC